MMLWANYSRKLEKISKGYLNSDETFLHGLRASSKNAVNAAFAAGLDAGVNAAIGVSTGLAVGDGNIMPLDTIGSSDIQQHPAVPASGFPGPSRWAIVVTNNR